jgi:hypothetical protein
VSTLFADVGPFWGWGFGQVVIAIVVIAAVLGIMWVALRQFGIAIPDFVVKIFWICVCAVVAIVAIKFVLSL